MTDAGPRHRAVRRPAAVACGAVLALQAVGLVLYSTHLFHRFDLTDDFATYGQAWWSIGHGHLDPVDTVQVPTYAFWRSHVELAMWPLALVGRLWPDPLQLLWWQDAALVATEAVVLLWIRDLTRGVPGRWRTPVRLWALAFVVAVPWWYEVASFDLHFETLGLPFVVGTGYALWRGRLRTAVLLGLCGLLFGDVVAVSLVCVGVAALLSRRSRRRIGAGRLVAVTAAALAWVGLVTALGGNQGSGIVVNYGYLVGAGPSATSGWVVLHLLAHPVRVARVLVDRRLAVGRVLLAGGVLGVATPWGLLAALGVVVPAALNGNTAFLTPTIAFQTVTAVPFLVVGTVMVLLRVAGPAPSGAARPRRRVVAAVAVAGVVTVASIAQGVTVVRSIPAEWWRVDARTAAALTTVQRLVPPGAEAIVSQGVIGRFADRSQLYPWLAEPQAFPVRAGVVAVVAVPAQGIESVPAAAVRADVSALLRRPGARLVVDRDGVELVLWRPPPGLRVVVLR